jgi:16S rRNA (guanine527-N7)-methyltransferase
MSIVPLSPTPEFLSASAELGVTFDAGDLERLGGFLALMIETNKAHNLTAIVDPEQVWMRHILDALTLMGPLAQLQPGNAGEPLRVMDVGSGGGVPGIPLAIAMPTAKFTLVDATGKKTDFLRGVCRQLEVVNVSVMQSRAEKLGQDPHHRERYDAVTARAVGAMDVLAEFCLPVVRPGGLMLAIKGAKADEEVERSRTAIGTLGGRVAAIVPTPTGRVVVVEKASRTPKVYPRPDGTPKARPLAATLAAAQAAAERAAAQRAATGPSAGKPASK